jgi:hypothetical protein
MDPKAFSVRNEMKRLSRHLPAFNFLHIHYIYFILTSLITGSIFWAISTPAQSVPYVDSLLFSVSAMTEAGLNTVNLSELNAVQQVILFILILIGSSIWVSAWVVGVRRRAFAGRFTEAKTEQTLAFTHTESC